MPNYIVKQPDGKFSIWSSIVDDFTIENLTEEEVLEYFEYYYLIKRAEKIKENLEKVKHNDDTAYGGHSDTYEKYCASSKTMLYRNIEKQFEKCKNADWDNDGASPASPESTKYGLGFVSKLPAIFPNPIISFYQDGELEFFWKTDTGSLLVKFVSDGNIIYSFDFHEKYESGTILKDESNRILIDMLDQIIN